MIDRVTRNTRVTDVINDPVLADAARLLFPAEDWYWSGDTLGNLSYTWYMRPDPQTTVDVVNRLRADVAAGRRVFYDIYTEEERRADPAKRDTGLYFFRGDPGAHVAIVNAASHAVCTAELLPFLCEAYADWADLVRDGDYPEDKHGYHMDPEELEKFNEMMAKFEG